MKLRQLLCILLASFYSQNISASTITFSHDQNVKVALYDATYPDILDYLPKFSYPKTTIFQLQNDHSHFYFLSIDSKDYFLWVENSQDNLEIDTSTPEMQNARLAIISKDKWIAGDVKIKNSTLKQIHEVDLYYSNALDSVNDLARKDPKFRSENKYNTLVWDQRSAKKLFKYSLDYVNEQLESDLVHLSPSYVLFWQMMYELYYQYYDTNAFKGLDVNAAYIELKDNFPGRESDVIVFYHFFRKGLPINSLNDHYQLMDHNLSEREQKLAQVLIQKQKIVDALFTQSIDFLFGVDIDAAMDGYFARDSSGRKNVIVFWSIWEGEMDQEFNKLADLKREYSALYNFVHICIDAYETPEKTKSFIYQNKVGGFHLLPQQSNAFRKSAYRSDFKIKDLPFYVMTDNNGEIVQTESIPLRVSGRLEEKLSSLSTKK